MSSEQVPFPSAVEAFIYQNFSASEGGPRVPVDISIFERAGAAGGKPSIASSCDPDADTKKRVAAAYDRGFETGRARAMAEAEKKIAEAKQMVSDNLKKFEQERELYFRNVEGEIVDLALAVARKILHREAQVDRVVLSGVVRVALEKISGTGQVSLCVHPDSAQAWRQYVASQHQLAAVPEIVEDGSLEPDQLILKTSHGSTSLGLDSQFAEIEKGFTDLVQQKQRSVQ